MRRACFTSNNFDDEMMTRAFEKAQPYFEYLIAYEERGESGTPHLQGYVELKKPASTKQLSGLIPKSAIFQCNGSQTQNMLYVAKGNQPKEQWDELKQHGPDYGKDAKLFYEYGTPKTQGKRTDLAPILEAVNSGMGIRAIAKNHPEQFIKFQKGIQAYHSALATPRSTADAKKVIVIFGPTGTGKTRYAFDSYPDAYMWGPEQGKWFDKYDGHKTVIMDEFRGQLPFGYLLRLLDRYPMKIEMKGGMTEFIADTIIITSPGHPSTWYDLEAKEGALDQLLRRIDEIRDLTPQVDPPVLERQFGL